jgi:hypothetical protein
MWWLLLALVLVVFCIPAFFLIKPLFDEAVPPPDIHAARDQKQDERVGRPEMNYPSFDI